MAINPYLKTGSGVGAAQSRKEENLVDQDGNFNPRRAKDSNERIYDSKGEAQVSSRREALDLATRAYDAAQTPQGQLILTRKTAQERTDRINNMMRSAALAGTRGARQIIAQELREPIQEFLDYDSWSSKVVRTRQLGKGVRHFIDRDIRGNAYTMAPNGQSIVTQVSGKHIPCDDFQLASFVEATLSDITHVSWDMVARMQSTAEQELGRERDKRVIQMIDEAAIDVNSLTTFSSVGVALLEALRYQIDRDDHLCDKFLIHRQELSDIVTTMAGTLDPVSQRELHLSGNISNFFGCSFLVSSGLGFKAVVQPGTIYALGAPDTIGEIADREMIEREYDLFATKQAAEGIGFVNIISMGIGNPGNIAKATRS